MPLPEVTLSTAQVWHMRLAARLCPDLLRELQCCWNGLCYKIILSSQSSWTLEIDIFTSRMPFQAQTTVLKHQRNSTTAKLLKIPHKANLKQIQQNEFTVTCTLSYRLRSQLTITAYSVLHERLSAMFISSSSQVNGTHLKSCIVHVHRAQ